MSETFQPLLVIAKRFNITFFINLNIPVTCPLIAPAYYKATNLDSNKVNLDFTRLLACKR
jgi:hypothetical protein